MRLLKEYLLRTGSHQLRRTIILVNFIQLLFSLPPVLFYSWNRTPGFLPFKFYVVCFPVFWISMVLIFLKWPLFGGVFAIFSEINSIVRTIKWSRLPNRFMLFGSMTEYIIFFTINSIYGISIGLLLIGYWWVLKQEKQAAPFLPKSDDFSI